MILGLFGAGGLGAEISDLIRSDSSIHEAYEEIVYIVTKPESEFANGLRLVSESQFFEEYSPDDAHVAICLGEPSFRKDIFERFNAQGFRFASLIHKNAHVASSASIGDGTIIYPGCYVGPNVSIGSNVVMISGSVVSHDSIVGNHCVICPATVISGGCIVEDESFFGSGSSIKDKTVVGAKAVIGLGAAVFKDVPAESSAIGNPARFVPRENGQRVFS